MAGFDGSVPCWIPDIPNQRDDELRIRTAQFGDGYAQRVADGINYLNQTWSLTWEMREAADVNAMVNYIAAARGNAFSFKEQPTGVIYQVWCDTWHVEWMLRRKGPLYWGTLSAEFRRAYGITA
jgi:phage-related protein